MRFKQLRIAGYRSLRDVTWDLGPLNVVIGPNGGGKTNLFQALELLKQFGSGGDYQHYIRRQGGARSVLWNGEAESITLGARMAEYLPTSPQTELLRTAVFEYAAKLNRQGDSELRANTEELTASIEPGDPQHINDWMIYERDINKVEYLAFKEQDPFFDIKLANVRNGDWPGLPQLRLGQSTEETVSSAPLLDFQETISRILTYQDLDFNEVRQVPLARYETKMEELNTDLVSVLHTLYGESEDFRDLIDSSLQVVFQGAYESLQFPPVADGRIQMKIKWGNSKFRPSQRELSDGTLRFLALLTILSGSSRQSLIAVDEPELGLHPKMFPIIAELAAEVAKTSTVIIATHSPVVLDALSKYNPTVAVVEWSEGETKLRTVDGELLKDWMGNYQYGDAFREGQLEGMI